MSATLLPDKLVMYQCKLCPQDKEIFLCETFLKIHLENHSAFFLKRWEKYKEDKCRVCEMVIDKEDMVEHADKLHPSYLFASIKDLQENGFYDVDTKISSPKTNTISSQAERATSSSLSEES